MKIAFLSTFYPYRGGIAQFNAAVYRAMEKMGYEVQAFTFRRQYPEILFPGTSQYVSPQDEADAIPARQLLDSINPLSYLQTGNAIRQYKPDILISAYWMPFFAPSLGSVLSFLGNNTYRISILHNVSPHEKRFMDKPLNQYFLRQNDAFVVLSEAVRQDLLSLHPQAHYLLYPHPVYGHFGKKLDKEIAQQQLNIPKGKKVILFFGLIRQYKGLHILLEALALLDSSYYLIIAGECYQDFAVYQQLIDRLGIQDRLQMHLRYITDQEVPLFFSAADVNILPYLTATQSGVVSTAYHFDLPVIVTDVGSLGEMVAPYHAGIVIAQAQTNLLRQAIQQMFAEGTSLYSQNIKNFKEKYSWERLGQEILKLKP